MLWGLTYSYTYTYMKCTIIKVQKIGREIVYGNVSWFLSHTYNLK